MAKYPNLPDGIRGITDQLRDSNMLAKQLDSSSILASALRGISFSTGGPLAEMVRQHDVLPEQWKQQAQSILGESLEAAASIGKQIEALVGSRSVDRTAAMLRRITGEDLATAAPVRQQIQAFVSSQSIDSGNALRQIIGQDLKGAASVGHQVQALVSSQSIDNENALRQIIGHDLEAAASVGHQIKTLVASQSIDKSAAMLGRMRTLGALSNNYLDEFTASLSVGERLKDILAASRQPSIAGEINKLTELLERSGVAAAAVGSNMILMDGTTFTAEDVNDVISEALTDVQSEGSPTQLRRFLGALLASVTRSNNPSAKAAIFFVLFWLTNAVVEGVVQTISGEGLKPITDAVIRRLIPRVRERIAVAPQSNLVDVRRLRLVAARDLQVRIAPRRNDSRIVAHVSTPTVVVLLGQRKDWSLISYRDGDAIIQGWVFTRYLRVIAI